MTFSQNVKAEIIRSLRNVKGCCAETLLRAALKSIGSLSLNFKGFSFTIESDNADFLELCGRVAERELGVSSVIKASNVNVKGAAVYGCEFFDNIGEKLGLTKRSADGAISIVNDLGSIMPKNACCKRSFMQGLFLSCGSVAAPISMSERTDYAVKQQQYHLELRLTDEAFAQAVQTAYPEIGFRMTKRKSYYILYVKDSDKIADYLVLVNAMANRLQLEKIMIERSVRNDANRQSNCIAANIGKSVDAAAAQLEAIAALRQKGIFETLPDKLKEIAVLREENPSATLDEIAAQLKISKSGANHRLVKIKELSQK